MGLLRKTQRAASTGCPPPRPGPLHGLSPAIGSARVEGGHLRLLRPEARLSVSEEVRDISTHT